MSLETWADSGWLVKHATTSGEVRELLALADRDLMDCKAAGLSADWRFNIAYNAVLQSATAALAAAGYRAARDSHHYRVLQSLALTVGVDARTLVVLEAFRKKRNLAGYERVGAVSDREADQVRAAAESLRRRVEACIRSTRPGLL